MKYYYRILQTHSARTHAHTRTHTHCRLRSGSMRRWHPSVTTLTPPFRLFRWHSSFSWPVAGLTIQINTHAGDPISPRFWMFFAYKKMLGRSETRTRDRMYCQTIRTVRNISRDDRARIATCRLLTPTDKGEL